MDCVTITSRYRAAHVIMRNTDGLQPSDALDEMLKFMFFKERYELEHRSDCEYLSAKVGIQPTVIANYIRAHFNEYLSNAPESIQKIWTEANIKLSDVCLTKIALLFADMKFIDTELDTRSAALREFISSDLRRGLGIYLTPDSVVRAIVDIVSPCPTHRVIDPACGSGTFLLEVVKLWGKENWINQNIYGIDKSPRMLALAELNLGHDKAFNFNGFLQDSLLDIGENGHSEWIGAFDCIFTNPPFGVWVYPDNRYTSIFKTCINEDGQPYSRQQSEILFIEQCFKLLKPGGIMAVVLPRSVATNHSDRLVAARTCFGTYGYVEGIMVLPPETFQSTGTNVNTIVVFARKYRCDEEANENTNPWIADVKNCGYDSTGRPKTGGQLKTIADEVRLLMDGGDSGSSCRWIGEHKKMDSFKLLNESVSSETDPELDGIPLGEITEIISTGRTPVRSEYSDAGLFLVKVGNLSGKGIEWTARDRNFTTINQIEKRKKAGLMLRVGDILMTSSAHSPVYIAKKVDIITCIPDWVGDASFVGEVMLIRPNVNRIDPFVLLMFLRSFKTMQKIQCMIRGQTAHLYPKDIAKLIVPYRMFDVSPEFDEILKMLREESRLANDSNNLQRTLSEKLAVLT